MTSATNKPSKRRGFPWFKRQSAEQRRANNPAFLRHMIIERANQLDSDVENPELEVSIAEMRETVDDYLYDNGILLPEDQLHQLLRSLNFHRDDAAKFQIELKKSLSKLDANT